MGLSEGDEEDDEGEAGRRDTVRALEQAGQTVGSGKGGEVSGGGGFVV